MRKNKITLLLLILVCACTYQNDQNDIGGKWYDAENNLVYDFFSNDSFRFHFQNGLMIKGSYNILKKNDRLILFLNFNGNTEAVDVKYNIDSCFLYFCNFKYNGNIDEIGFFRRDTIVSNIHNKSNHVKHKIIIDDSFVGDAFINFNSSGEEIIEDNVKYIYLPHSGILKTRSNINPFEIVKNEITFENKESKVSIPSFYYLEYSDINKLLALGYHKDSVCVCIYGFNQIGRSSINKEIFKEEIYGNVLMFKVDTLSKLLMKSTYRHH